MDRYESTPEKLVLSIIHSYGFVRLVNYETSRSARSGGYLRNSTSPYQGRDPIRAEEEPKSERRLASSSLHIRSIRHARIENYGV